jgi:positive regulator of sigma E activity
MSRVLIAIGIAAVICVVILGTVFGFLLIRGRAEDESSAKAAHDIVLSIVSTWNEDAFMANSSQELKKS